MLVPRLALSQNAGETADTAFVRWVNEVALRLDSAAVIDSKANVEALRRVVLGARIVGIGESQHNMHELLTARYSVARLLVSHFGFTGVAMESGLPEARRIDDWITTDSTKEPVFSNDLAYGFGRDAETVNFLRWLREFNSMIPAARRAHFYGVDLPRNGGGDIAAALQPVWDFLAKVDPPFGQEQRSRVEPLARRLTSAGWWDVGARFDSLGSVARDSLRDGIAAVIDRLTKHRAEYARLSTRDAVEWAERLALVASQTESSLREGKLTPTNPRDTSMAANATWAMERERPRGPIVLLAHNTHVDAEPSTGQFATDRLRELGYTGPPRPITSMGSVLRARLGSGYVTVGTAFRMNTAQAIPHVSDSTSIDGVLARVGIPAFLLDVRGAPRSAETAWLDRPHPMRTTNTYVTVVPRRSFDALIYIDRIRPSEKIRRSPSALPGSH